MEGRLAYLKDSTSVFYEMDDGVILLLKPDYKWKIIPVDIFEDLFYVVDHNKAALKEDCIECTMFSRFRPLHTYPEWYLNAVTKGLIYGVNDYPEPHIWRHIDGDIPMTEGSYILRNFMGDLRYVDARSFERYYEL